MRLIDADAFEVLCFTEQDGTFSDGVQWLAERIDEAPTVDAVPREELFDLFTEITAAEYGKQRFFMQKDGTVYDRHKGDYLHNFDLAVVRFCNELSGW